VPALGAADVEEGADGLLRPVLVVALSEVDQVPAGQVGGERHGDRVLPLPRVDGQEPVPGRVQAQTAELPRAPASASGPNSRRYRASSSSPATVARELSSLRAASQTRRTGVGASGVMR